MTVLQIRVPTFTNTLIAVEIYCGDDVKYVESFDSWSSLLDTLEKYFDEYAYIEVKQS